MSGASLNDSWGHVINPTPGQLRRAARRIIEQALDVGAPRQEITEALQMIGCKVKPEATS